MSFGISVVETMPFGLDIDVSRKLIMQDADEALYQARNSGRNKIVARGLALTASNKITRSMTNQSHPRE